jgi:hypothetical protein
VNSAAGVGAGRDPREHEFPLFRVIDAVRSSEEAIVTQVEERRARLAERTGSSGQALADALARELIDDAALRSALLGAGAALPIPLPFIGPWASLVLAVVTGAFLQVANDVELVYQIAAAYRTRLSSERLRLVAFWLVRLTNYDELQEKALAIGVRVTVRKLTEKLIAVGLARAVGATATGLMVTRVAGNLPAPWYVRATAWLGVPVLAVLGWRGTRSVGERATAYFSEELAGR